MDLKLINKDEEFGGRTFALKALTGSHNYLLNGENSDRDYKYFVFPTFDDLYHSKYFSTSFNSPELDYTVHDVRKLPELFFKSNLNFLEVLFSSDVECCPSLSFLFHKRNAIAKMNLPALYNACIGMHKQKRYGMTKGESPQAVESISRFGYDVKQVMHSYRVLDFLHRFAGNGFADFGKALRYKNGDGDYLRQLKTGYLSKYEAEMMLDNALALLEDSYIPAFYKNQPVNAQLYVELQSDIQEEVRYSIMSKELNK